MIVILGKSLQPYAGRVLWLIPPEEATEENLSSTDVSLHATPTASPRSSSLEEVRRRLAWHLSTHSPRAHLLLPFLRTVYR